MTEDPDIQPGVPPAPTVSAVIPTRNRRESLERALRSLASQTRPPDEVVVVDASDTRLDEETLARLCGSVRLTYRREKAGVCYQRNVGIRTATGSHILLYDDDIEAGPDYLSRLMEYLDRHPDRGAVTGMFQDVSLTDGPPEELRPPSLKHLLFSFVFQLNIKAPVEKAVAGRIGSLPLALLKRWYRRRGNSWSLAGWPLLTQVGAGAPSHEDVASAAIYTLGAALVRRDWLLAAPYDERLTAHGIGDNYGVALGFPGESPISLLTDLAVPHHRAPENRLAHGEAYFRRVLALDYFVRTSGRFGSSTPAWLAWSLLGNAALFGLRGRRDLARRSVGAMRIVVTGRNPLLEQAPASPATVPTASPQ